LVDRSLAEEVNQLHAQLCQSLADPTRILMLYSLADGPRYVTELAELLDVTQPTVSRHLKILRDQRLVHGTRVGNTVHYELVDHRIIDALDLLREVMASLLSQQAELAEAVSL
jgi:ArsR family transcriptional regulator